MLLLGVFGLTLAIIGCQKSKEEDATAKKSPEQVTIYIARHGKTMLNTTDRSQGWIDAPLTPLGVSVAENLGRGLADVKFDAVYSSDSGRAVETAVLILKNNGQAKLIDQLTTDMRLREFNFGTFEGMPNEEMWGVIAEKQGLTLEEWQANMAEDGFVPTIKAFANTLHELDGSRLEAMSEEQGVTSDEVSWRAEDYQTVVERTQAVLNDIVKQAETKGQENILVTSHGMTIAALVSALDAAAEIPATGLKNASVCKVVYKDGSFTVESVNDLSYVEKGNK